MDTSSPSRYPYVPLPDRGPLRFPGGAQLALIYHHQLGVLGAVS
jgi:hypothetical protein